MNPETFKTQSAAAIAVSGGRGAHISRTGVVTSLDRYTTFGRVQKVAPGRWIIAERADDGRFCAVCGADVIGNDPHAPWCRIGLGDPNEMDSVPIQSEGER